MKIEQGRVSQPGVFTVAQIAHAMNLPLDSLVRLARELAPPLVLASLGYEGRTLQQLIEEAHRQSVDFVVDVRLNPISRKPGLSKTKLGQALEGEGIRYVHRRVLGNPKENRALFAGDDLEVGQARFRQVLRSDEAHAALVEVAGIAREHRVALLCFEADESRCHRRLVAEAVAAIGR